MLETAKVGARWMTMGWRPVQESLRVKYDTSSTHLIGLNKSRKNVHLLQTYHPQWEQARHGHYNGAALCLSLRGVAFCDTAPAADLVKGLKSGGTDTYNTTADTFWSMPVVCTQKVKRGCFHSVDQHILGSNELLERSTNVSNGYEC